MRTTAKRLCAFLLALVMVIAVGVGGLTPPAFAEGETTTLTYHMAYYTQYETVTIGEDVNLPWGAWDMEGWTFIGWLDQPLYLTQTKPSFYEPGAAYTVTTADPVIYALYKRVEPDGSFCYELVKDAAFYTFTPGVYVLTSGRTSDMHVMTGVSGNTTIEGTALGSTAFADVSMDDYDYMTVLWAVENGVTVGASETTFSPNRICTRAQIVTFLWRAADSPEPTITESPFNDVQNPNAYYYKAVLWAYENGITTGVGSGTFGVNQGCSRAQIVTFLWRLADSPEPASSSAGNLPASPFDDVQNPSDWYYSAVLWAAENQITVGTAPNVFSPDQTCSRAQAVTFLYRYYTGNEATE